MGLRLACPELAPGVDALANPRARSPKLSGGILAARYAVALAPPVCLPPHPTIDSATISIEAGQINNLGCLLLRFGDEASLNIRQLLSAHIESIIKVEWPKLEFSEGSEETHMIWRKISQSIFKLKPRTDKQFVLFDAILTKSEEVSESRERRIDCASDRFPVIYWVVIFFAHADPDGGGRDVLAFGQSDAWLCCGTHCFRRVDHFADGHRPPFPGPDLGQT